jgi:hypothetical protein
LNQTARAMMALATIGLGLAACSPPSAAVRPTPILPSPPGGPAAFVGTWAMSAAGCSIDQSMEDAPLLLSADGYDQHETHCRFDGLREPRPGRFETRTQCEVQGDTQEGVLEFEVQGDTLTLYPGAHARRLVRCPPAPSPPSATPATN